MILSIFCQYEKFDMSQFYSGFLIDFDVKITILSIISVGNKLLTPYTPFQPLPPLRPWPFEVVEELRNQQLCPDGGGGCFYKHPPSLLECSCCWFN